MIQDHHDVIVHILDEYKYLEYEYIHLFYLNDTSKYLLA